MSSYRGAVALRDAGGRALTFQETTLGQAARELAHEGLWQEYSGVAGLAALREARQRGETVEEPVVAVLTSTRPQGHASHRRLRPRRASRRRLIDVIAALKK